MTTFLTVKEAARRTGRSPSSIRRLIYPILHDDSHPDRAHVEPNPAEAVRLRTKGEAFAWQVSEDFLLKQMPPDDNAEKGTDAPGSRPAHTADPELVAMLRRELDIKNEQITQYIQANSKLMDTINSLTERLREGNILMGSLQQQLQLADGRGVTTAAEPVKAKRATATRPEKGSTTTATKPAPVTKVSKPAKRGFIARWFGGR